MAGRINIDETTSIPNGDEGILQQIHRTDQEIEAAKADLKKVSEAIQDCVENTKEYKEIQELKDLIKTKQADLKGSLQMDRQYNRMTEEKAELQFKLKDLKEILSHHLIRYNQETQEVQVPIASSQTKAKQLIITAKLGKEEYYQERMKFKETK